MAMKARGGRGGDGPGKLAWTVLGGAGLMVLGLTFALGMLVGRQWARQTTPGVAADSGRRTATAAHRPGLAEPGGDRALAPTEKLTFYKTLTAPLGDAPLSGKADPAPKSPAAPKSHAAAASAADRAPEPRDSHLGGSISAPRASPAPVEDGRAQGTGERSVAKADWVVQVGVFKTSDQAERVKKKLTDGGFPAGVTPVGGADGQTWYRVRVTGFKTRDQALKTAERVRTDRALPTFVTSN
jgi:cell division protein FtsN